MYNFNIGTGGSAGNAGGVTWFNASTTSPFTSAASAPTATSNGILARGGNGVANNATTGGTGGAAGTGTGASATGIWTSAGYSGGNGGTGTGSGTGGGGGGAGSSGNGGNGGVTAGGNAGAGYGGGNGANGRTTAGNGYNGFERYGSGGSGCRRTNSGNRTGGSGTQGFIRLTYVSVTATATPATICIGGSSTLSGNTNTNAVTLYSENFERYNLSTGWGSPLFTNTENWGWKGVGTNYYTYWTISPTAPISGAGSLCLYDSYWPSFNSYYGDGDWYGYSNNILCFDNSQKIIATNYTNLLMSFKWQCVGESGYDYGMICYSTDGTTWTNITTGGPNNDGRYLDQSATQTVNNLALPAALNGQQFWIGFRWINDGSVNNDPPFKVDDITITGTPSVSYAWSGGSPNGGSTPTAQTTSVSPSANTTYNYTLNVGGVSATTNVTVSTTSCPIPTITSFTPSSVCASNNATVTITGTNLSQVTSVSIGGTPAQSFTINSSTQITATVGAGTTGTISISNASGTGTSSSSITVVSPATTPVANAASSIAGTVATANWNSASGATTYYIDVSTSSTFSSFVGAYNNLNVGNVTSLSLTGLTPITTYYYRVRSSNGICLSTNSGIISFTTLCEQTGNPATYGNGSWIGYVYNSSSAGGFDSYQGYVTESETFDRTHSTIAAGATAAHCSNNSDFFAIRYRMTKNLLAGYYTFTIGGDDGVRLSLDGGATWHINGWVDQGYTTYSSSSSIYLTGNTNLVFEYYENGGGSRSSFSYTFVPDPCSSITTISSCSPTTFAVVSGNGLYNPPSASCGFNTPGTEKIFSFTPSVSGIYRIEQTSSFGYVDWFYKQASNGCGGTGWICFDDLTGTGNSPYVSLTGGIQYYILADPESTGGGNVTFKICPILPPSSVTCSAPGIVNASWTPASNSNTPYVYYVQIDQNPTFSGTWGAGSGLIYVYSPSTSYTWSGALPNTTYYVHVASVSDGWSYNGVTNSSGCTTPAASVNDLCANATNLTVSAPPANFSFTGAYPSNGGYADASYPDKWYKFTPSCNGTFQIALTNSSYDADIYLYTDCSTTTNLLTGGATSANNETGSANLISGQTYYLRVVDFAMQYSTFSLQVTITSTPTTPTTITVSGTEPTCQLSNSGTTTDYNSTATTGTLSWSLTGISNTAGTLTSSAINASTGVVTWPNGWAGSVTINVVSTGCNGPSTAVTRLVTVNPLPTASIASNNGPICSGNTATFNLSGTSGAVVTYNINGGSNTTVTLTGGSATVSVANATANQTLNLVSVNNPSTSCSQSLSGSSMVTVNPLPTASIASNNGPICSGNTATFNLSGTSGAVVTYNVNGGSNTTVTLTGGSATVSVANATANQTLNLVSVNNPSTSCSQSLSGSSTVTVNPLPNFTTQPQATSICTNGSGSFTVATTASSPSYQWQYSSDNGSTWNNTNGAAGVTGHNTATLDLVNPDIAWNGFLIRCQITSGAGCGPINSNAVTMTIVNSAPSTSVAAGDYIWGGSVDTDYATFGNWYEVSIASPLALIPASNAPTFSTNVVIPGTCVTNMPQTNANTNLEAKALTIESGATLTINSGTLTVYDDFHTNAGGTLDFGTTNTGKLMVRNGDFHMDGTFNPGYGTIEMYNDNNTHGHSTYNSTANNRTYYNLYVTGAPTSNFDMHLSNNINVTHHLYIETQKLDLNNYGIDLGTTGQLVFPTGTEEGDNAHLYEDPTNMGNGYIQATRVISGSAPINPGNLGLQFTPNPSKPLGSTVVRRYHKTYNVGTNTTTGAAISSIARSFEVTPTFNGSDYGGSLDVDLLFHYFGSLMTYSGLPSNAETNLKIWRRPTNGLTWDEMGGAVFLTDDHVTIDNFAHFSEITLAPSAATALPIELVSFQANCKEDNSIAVTWTTASEHNTSHYVVEKSRDGNNWSVLGQTAAAGNSTQLLNYELIDSEKANGTTYYRLTQYDNDGVYEVFDPVSVNCNGTTTNNHIMTYPNPSLEGFNVSLYTETMFGEGKLTVNDSRGRKVYEKSVDIQEGNNVFHIGDMDAAPGMYYIQVSNGTTTTDIVKHSLR